MIVRVAVAVVVAAALATAAAPAIDHARTANADRAGALAADDVADAVTELARSTPAPAGTPPATRTLTVSLPPTDAASDRVTLLVGAAPDAPDAATSDVVGVRTDGRVRTTALPVDVRVRATPDGRLRGDDTGLRVRRATLVLRYVRLDGRPTVTVTPLDGAEVYTRGRDHGDP